MGLRILVVSCGAEEALQDGIRGFLRRHAGELPHGRTWVLNLETIGSPSLALLEGEGPLVMRDYRDPSFRDLVARASSSAGIALERDLRSRASTDSVIPSRAGYPTATLSSVTSWRSLANYLGLVRKLLVLQAERVRPQADLVLDGSGALEPMLARAREQILERLP